MCHAEQGRRVHDKLGGSRIADEDRIAAFHRCGVTGHLKYRGYKDSCFP
jgi:hypothetical protein